MSKHKDLMRRNDQLSALIMRLAPLASEEWLKDYAENRKADVDRRVENGDAYAWHRIVIAELSPLDEREGNVAFFERWVADMKKLRSAPRPQ